MAETSSTDAKFLLSQSRHFALSGVDVRAAHINLAMQCCANFPSLARSAENIASSGAKNRTGSGEEKRKGEMASKMARDGNWHKMGSFSMRTHRLLLHFLN